MVVVVIFCVVAFVVSIVALSTFWWDVGLGNLFKSFSIVAIVLKHIYRELYFCINLFFSGAKSVSTAQLGFESGYGGGWVLTALGLDSHVGIGRLTVDAGGKITVVLTCDKDVEEGDGIVFLFLTCKLDSLVNRIEKVIKINGRVRGGG